MSDGKVSVYAFSFALFHTDLTHCHAYLVEMNQLLQSMDVLHRTYSAPAINAMQVSHVFLLLASGKSSPGLAPH